MSSLSNPAFKKIYNEILDAKLKAYAKQLEVELSAAQKIINDKPAMASTISGNAAPVVSGMLSNLADLSRNFRSSISIPKIGNTAKGLALAASLATAGLHIAPELGNVYKLGNNAFATNVAKPAKPAKDEIAKAWLDLNIQKQNINDPNIISQLKESQARLSHQFEDKPVGAFVNLAHPSTNIHASINAVEPQKGYNVLGAHGIFNSGIMKGASAEEAALQGLQKGEILSANLIAESIKAAPGYNPNYPIKLLNCEIGKAHVAQEISDILGVPVVAATENIWLGKNSGVLAVAKTGADNKVDLTKPGQVLEFKPRQKNERGSLLNYHKRGTVGFNNNSQRASSLENIVQAPKEFFSGKSASDIVEQIKSDKYYNPNLPINLMAPFDNKKVLDEIANITNQSVNSFSADSDLKYTQRGFSHAVRGNGAPDRGTIYYPSNYKNKADVSFKTRTSTPWVEYAESQLGVKESAMNPWKLAEGNNKSPEIDSYLRASNVGLGNPWCASFIEWAMQKAGVEGAGKYSAVANTWANYGQRLENPAFGSIATYKQGKGSHAGFVVGKVKDDPNKVILLGGNQGDSVNYIVKDTKDFNFNYPNDYTPNYSVPTYDRERLGHTKTTTTFQTLTSRAIVE